MAQGYYGTEDSPLDGLHSERVVLTPHTSGEPDQYGMRLRTDLNSGDRIATVLVNNGSVGQAPVFPDGTSTESGVAEGPPVYVPGEGWGFVAIQEQGGVFEEYVIWHDSTRYGVHNSLTAPPDSEANQKLVHRWILDDVNGTVVDSVGNADGTVNGVSSTSGAWAGGIAGDGDGTNDYIETTTLGSYGSSLDTDFAIAFSLQSTESSGADKTFGAGEFGTTFGIVVEAPTRNGKIGFNIGVSGSDNITRETDTTHADGNPHRVVINKTGNSASGINIWVNQSDVAVSTVNSGFDWANVADFSDPFSMFARVIDGTPERFVDCIIDDVCLFNDSLTSTEIQSYNNPWS